MHRIRHLACAVALALTTSTAAVAAQSESAATANADSAIPTGQLPRTVVPTLVELELKLDPAQERFSGRTVIHADVAEPTDVVWMHGRDLDIKSAEAVLPDGSKVALDAEQVHVSGVLKLTAAQTLPAGKVDIAIAFEAPYGNLMGAYRVKPKEQNYIVTQMEPLGARSTFPGFDEPSFKQPWDVTLIVPDADTAIANAPAEKTEDLDGPWKKITYARTEALPTYLLAFVVGPWDVPVAPDIAPNGERSRPIPLRGVAAAGEGERMAYSLEHTPAITLALEDYFGIPYPFAKLDNVAAPDFGAGAMENAGLIIYRDTLMLLDEESSVGQRQGFWGVSAHELAHQWFGNLVTMAWWDDLWLNEAFATWMGNKITGQLQPEFHTDRNILEGGLRAMGADSLASTRRIHQPISDFTQIASAFDGITYQKGGAVLSMFENFVGEENFRKGIHDYLVEHARGNATSTDLIQSVAAQSDNPAGITAAFLSFIDQPGVPMVKVDVDCADGKSPALTLSQQRYLPLGSTASAAQTWGIPMCVRYAADGKVHEQCGLVDGQQARFELEDAQSCPAWVMPNAHGDGYYRFALAPKWQQSLSDAFADLDEREQRVYADSAIAAYGAGDLSVSQMIAALPQFATADARQTATAGMWTFEWINEHLLDDAAEEAKLRAHFADIYRPRLQALGMESKEGESDDERLLRSQLIGYFAEGVEDPTVRADFVERGNRVLGLGGDGQLDADAVARDLRDTAVAVAVQEGGAAAFELAEKHLRASDDAVIRRELLSAMGGVTDPALAARARGFVLEPGLLRLNEIFSVIFSQADHEELRPALREWLEANYDALQAKLDPGGSAIASAYAAGMCSTEDAAALQARFGKRMETVEGGPLDLKQQVEEINLCAAAKAAREGRPIEY
ncbi:M1 family metallopeptidase [Novilysobacter erysipheiresistens]|uniref:Aminopeptidase n=1 Tax=Novilysobacter erysipheiresistens TaxID=1749332 RepID=A0ABU7Z1T7_9GAMM